MAERRSSKAPAPAGAKRSKATGGPSKTPAPTRTSQALARASAPLPPEPAHRHPNLGKPPIDMTAGYPAAADAVQGDKTVVATRALEAVVAHDPEFRARFSERGMLDLIHDAEVLTGRLAMCLRSNETRWLPEYAEWLSPILRRRGVAQADIAAICEGIREVVGARLGPDERALADRAIDAAVEVFRKNGRIGGDPHKRNALLRWLYRGV